jgi:hypothetical protein
VPQLPEKQPRSRIGSGSDEAPPAAPASATTARLSDAARSVAPGAAAEREAERAHSTESVVLDQWVKGMPGWGAMSRYIGEERDGKRHGQVRRRHTNVNRA